MKDFFLGVLCFFLTSIQVAFIGYTKPSYHINVAEVILMHGTVCQGSQGGQLLTPESNIALKQLLPAM